MSKNKRSQIPTKNEVSLRRSSAAEYLTFVAATGSAQTSVEMRYEDENIWLTQKMIATDKLQYAIHGQTAQADAADATDADLRDGQQPIIFMQYGPTRQTATKPTGAPRDSRNSISRMTGYLREISTK